MRKTCLLRGLSGLAICICTPVASQAGTGQAVDPAKPPATSPSTPTPATDASAPAGQEGRDAVSAPDIVVTAARRSESITKVTTAVSAFSGAALRDAQVNSLTDLAAIAPNVQIKASYVNANITVRGIGNGNFTQAGGDPGVAVEFDGVYLGQPSLALATFLDVNRVEVLRGPQGTLFGRNATGGEVNIIPNTPTSKLAYGLDLSAGVDPTMLHTSGYLSGPLTRSGVLLWRVAAEQNYARGFTRNLAPDGPRWLDGIDDAAVRGQLEWRPSANFIARLLVEYQRRSDSGQATYLLGTTNPGPVILPYAFVGGGITVPTGLGGDPRSREAFANHGSNDSNAKTVNLTADWTIGEGHLKGLVSYNSSKLANDFDVDGTPFDYSSSMQTNRARQFYEEVTYTSNGSRPFNFVVGQNFYTERFRQTISTLALALGPMEPVRATAGGDLETKSFAFFAHAQYAFTPWSKMFAGIRYTHDSKSVDEFYSFPPFVDSADVKRASWSDITYEAGLSQDLGRAATAYLKYATGYKGGGFAVGSLGPSYEPEKNKSFEVGLKGTYLGGAVRANLAVFHTTYDDLQVNQIIGLTSVVDNAARATIDGVELETVLRPTRRLRIEANVAWLHARFDQYQTADSARPQLGTIDLAGNLLPDAPRFNASLGTFYDLPVASGTVTAGGRFDWKSKIYFSQFNIPISSQRSVGKLDLFLNFRSSDSRWTGGLFAKNVTGQVIKQNVVVITALLGSIAEGLFYPGRQLGVSLGYHF